MYIPKAKLGGCVTIQLKLSSFTWVHKKYGVKSSSGSSHRDPPQDSKQSISLDRGFRYFFCMNTSATAPPGRPDPELAVVDFWLSAPALPYAPSCCTIPEHSLHNQYFAVERIQLILNYRLANLSLPVQLENKQPHLISCMYVFPAYSLALPWHFNSSRRLLACQQWSIALTLSLNYTITLLCTVVWAIKHLKYFKQIHFKGLKEKRHNPTLIQTTC